MKQTRLTGIVAISLVVLILLGGATGVNAAPRGCTLNDLQGSYAFVAHGATTVGLAVAAIGILSFDGAGNITGGFVDPVQAGSSVIFSLEVNPAESYYRVTASCGGFFLVRGEYSGARFDIFSEFVLIDGGREFLFWSLFAGVIPEELMSGTARKQ